jgi:hypothetical protein
LVLSQVNGWGEGNFTKSNWGGDKLEDMAAVARVRKTKPENRDPQMVVVQRVSRAADEAELVAIREDNVGLDGDAMAMELQQVVEEDRAKQRKMTR